MTKKDKIQHLIISYLLENGQIAINLPDGLNLEIGITQEGKHGNLIKKDNYCWVVANMDDRTASIDSYNLGLKFLSDENLVFEYETINENGENIKMLDVI